MGGKGSKNKEGGPTSHEESKQQEQFTTIEPASVLINVYQPQNPGLLGGVYHSGLQVYDTEHMFASGSSSLAGIHSHRPKQVEDPQWVYRETVNLGPTTMSREEVRNLLAEMKSSGDWAGNSYSLTGKNCNHFAQELSRRLGRSNFPSWINRGARMANAIGMGGAAGSQQAVDLEGRPLKESDRQALVMEVTQDVCLDSVLDYKGVSQLGAKPSHNLMSIIPVDVKDGKRIALKVDHSISSDADEQLLLFLPFLRPVKLLSFLLRLSVKDPACNPKTLKMFANRPNMDFGDADSTTPATTVEVPLSPGRPFTKEETKEGLWEFVATVDRVKFAQTSFLTIFIESNHGAKATRLFGLTLVGREN